ncbi:MAG: hypothetical protein A2W91_11980 [Bacteroidetes bacterium GWF2_38_335]|nr:MAG: hypothetical protein A2W91_11980 [Bacteroidetes bacterium GWF2_38_335]OFY76892.1 MAG: hypothetical protein A2281_00095 [Bacteroidetes bacterium RIFOXYA12_FULL_38_20]HBS86740.1 hypothetical protein [Bacteroidales bacterium]
MRKITLLTALLISAVFVFGQTFTGINDAKINSKKDNIGSPSKKEFKPMANAKATIFEEDFEGWETTWPPTGWTQIDGVSSAQHWAYSTDTENGGNGTGQARVQYDFNQDEWLITPAISIPSTGIYMFSFDWSMYYDWMVSPNENGDFTIEISTDGGSTWTMLWNEDDQLVVETPTIPWPWETYTYYTSQLDLTAYAGMDVQFALHYVANDAARVQIDNIKVYEAYEDELVITRPHFWFNYGGGYLAAQPYEQLVGIFFGAHVWNNGINDATNLVLSAEVLNEGSSLYLQTKDTVILSAGMEDSIGIATGFAEYLPDFGQTYDVTISVASDAVEPDMTNNEYATDFIVTEGTFARWKEYTGGVSAWNFVDAADGDYCGVKFYVPNADTLYGCRVFIDDRTNPGTTIVPKVYQITETERIEFIIGDEIDILESDLGNWINIAYPDATGTDLVVEAGFTYYVGFECYFGTDTLLFGTDAIGAPHNYQYESVLRQGADSWYYFESAPMIELFTADIVSAPEVTAANSNINVYPNPTEGVINFTNVAKSKITVYNVLGEVVAQVNNANDLTTIDLSRFDNGTYTVKIENNSKVVIKKVVLSK